MHLSSSQTMPTVSSVDTGFTQSDRSAFRAWIAKSSFRMIVSRVQYDERVRVLRALDAGNSAKQLLSVMPHVTRVFVHKTRYNYSLSPEGRLLYHARRHKGPLYVVSDDEIFDVVEHEHNAIEHQGMNKTWHEIAPRYHGIPRDAVNWIIKRCSVCHSQQPNYRALFDVPIVSMNPMERIQMDLIDMRLNPDAQYQWVLHIKDHFSRFCMLFPIRERTSAEVAAHFATWVAFMGAPHILQTDHGPEFTDAVAQVAQQYGIRIVRGKPLVPRTQGLVERANGHVRRLIAKWCLRHRRTDWAASLVPITLACNSAVHASTGLSPFQVVFSRKPRRHTSDLTGADTNDYLAVARASTQRARERMVQRKGVARILPSGTSVSVSCAGPGIQRRVTDCYRMPGIVVCFEPPLGYRVSTAFGILDQPVPSRRVRVLHSEIAQTRANEYSQLPVAAPRISMEECVRHARSRYSASS